MPSILSAPTRLLTELIEDPALNHDFSRFSAYIDDLGVVYLSGRGKESSTLPVEPPRADTGSSEFETRPDFGNFFSQGDFSGGGLQREYHRPTADKERFWESEGFDISKPGLLQHLNSVTQVDPITFTAPLYLEEADGLPFLAQGTSVYVGSGSFPGTWSAEDPSGSESAATVLDLTSRGDEVFAALGAAGVHIRSSAGVWDHYQPDAATDLDTGTTTKVAWLKDRLFVVGASGRSLYEVVADSTPTAVETLPESWTFEGLFEVGPFVYATAVSLTSGLSRIHAFGLNDAGSAIEKKASTAMPKGDLAYSGIGYLGRAFVGGGRQNESDGLDPFLYEAIPADNGSLQLLLISADEGPSTSDLSVRCFASLRESIVFGWSRSTGRVGLGSYNLARNAFTQDLRDNTASSTVRVVDVIRYRGRMLFTTESGFFFEALDSPVPSATLITSAADWNNAGLKDWSLFQVKHDPLVINTSVTLEYTKRDPEFEEWEPALTSDLPGSSGSDAFLQDVKSRTLSVRLTSTASGSNQPMLRSFSVRSTPAPEQTEWTLVRTVRVVDRDRKDRRAEPVKRDPRAYRDVLHGLAYTWVTLYEPGATWIGYVQSVKEAEPAEAPASETRGAREAETFYVELRLVARRAT